MYTVLLLTLLDS